MVDFAQKFVIFGSFPAISAAELFAAYGHDLTVVEAITRLGAILGVDLPRPFEQFGGLVKTGSIVGRFASYEEAAQNFVGPKDAALLMPPGDAKVHIGVSIYASGWSNEAVRRETRRLGKMIKSAVGLNRSARWVESRERVLSSVVVTTNHLLDRGVEVVFFEVKGIWWVGKTTAVQDYARYSARDYGRPQRDDASGMLPPKLAQILLNLVNVPPDAPILDPFCGSGTVLMEALLAGYQSVWGSDIENEAVRATGANLTWLRDHERIPAGAQWKVVQSDVRNIHMVFPDVKFSAIVTEPFLGPSGGFGPNDLPSIAGDLTALYRDAFHAFTKALMPFGMIAIILPVFFLKERKYFLPLQEIVDQAYRVQLLIPPAWHDIFSAETMPRQSLIYRREGQRVGRELFVFRRA